MKRKGIGKTRLEVLKLAERRGVVTFADMRRNVMPALIAAGLMKYYGERFQTPNGGEDSTGYVLTSAGAQFLEDLKKEK